MINLRLHSLIGKDWQEQKWLALLLLACVVSAFFVVHFAHLNRQVTIERDVLYQERDQLDNEWRNLLLEQRALSEHSRVEDIARSKLNMARPSLAQDVAVNLP